MINRDDIDRAAILVCNERQRLILHLRYHEDLSLRQIAERLELHHATVNYHHDRAIAMIRQHLEGDTAA
jgi:RNA polymerase sigma factor (sigma-70 family)